MKRKWNEEPQSALCREGIAYFREHAVFDRMMAGFREKYESYGYFTGTVLLRRLTAEDIDALEGFLGKSYHGKKSASISAAAFEKALESSRFAGLAPQEILEHYFRKEMIGKKEWQQLEEEKRQRFLESLLEKYRGTPAEKWLEENHAQKEEKFLTFGAEMVNALPCRRNDAEYLAVFAAKFTGNPHAFDDGTREGQILKNIVLWNYEQLKLPETGREIFPALQKQRRYLAAGLLRDDISNYAMVSGIRARKRDGTFHEGMNGFFREGDCVQIPLSVIAEWEGAECPGGEIYIVENPSVYALLSRSWRAKRACMCMNGQPRLSSILILELLAKEGVKVYYAGDFDPEGLLIAQKIRLYYKGPFSYWHITAEDYEKCLSQKIISQRRLKMLERVTDRELEETVAAIQTKKLAGYQEKIWKEYLMP